MISLDHKGGLLYAYHPDGMLQIFKTSDLQTLIKDDFMGVLYIPPHLKSTNHFHTKKLRFSGQNLVNLAELPSKHDKESGYELLVIENMYNFNFSDSQPSSFFGDYLSYLRYLIPLFVFGSVGFYQYYKWKSNNPKSQGAKGSLGNAKGVGKNSAQANAGNLNS